ncbi:hypothetical protein G6F61_014541 [Rhizopus arrhizus]|nr:hypothetical protein G6F61_014541 [Rhizopus arrhizus]
MAGYAATALPLPGARPSWFNHDSRMRRYEHPAANAMTVRSPRSRALVIAPQARGEISGRSSVTASMAARPSAENGWATNAASMS